MLEQRGRRDVIAALKKHEIGYHSNTHSGQPTIAVYLQHAGWDEGVAEFYRREEQGVRDVTRIFGTTPTCYGQPGAAWAPQTYPALTQAGHRDVPRRSRSCRHRRSAVLLRRHAERLQDAVDAGAHGADGGTGLADGKATFTKAYDALRARGGGTISVYYHPNEWVQTEFWDGVNFSGGANPPRSEWKPPGTRPPAETEAAFRDFAAYLALHESAARRAVRHRERSDAHLQGCRALEIVHPRRPRRAGSRRCRQRSRSKSETATSSRRRHLRAAEHGSRIVRGSPGHLPPRRRSRSCMDRRANSNPLKAHRSRGLCLGGVRGRRPRRRRVPAVARTSCRPRSGSDRKTCRLPTILRRSLAASRPSPTSGRPPAQVERRTGRFTADQYVAADSPKLWSWPIFPPGFHAPDIMTLARLQAWTLKPAL